MLKYLASDIISDPQINKSTAFPSLRTEQLNTTLSQFEDLRKDVKECLGAPTMELSDISALCLCSEHFSDPKKLREWWDRRVKRSSPDTKKSLDVYRLLAARSGADRLLGYISRSKEETRYLEVSKCTELNLTESV
ncbi:hypothetical protein C0Q70_18433 [Pomacea canaliculata]|uniref:Uncharacterized protein n=1 Tax=Pomacea canaliculata TaxID=400727 RepID=A0A2T7NN79_POMCA|nr:hypothetical protein C0Q70_18433 [Pomacea canaliculata]